MCLFRRFLTVALLALTTSTPANAYMYMGGDEVLDELGLYTPPMDSEPPRQYPQQPQVRSTSTPQVFVTRDSDLKFQHDVPNDVNILGYWAGNLQYAVGRSQKRLYVIDKQMRAAILPPGTNPDNIVIPMDNAFVRGVMNAQPTAGPETQARAQKGKPTGPFITGGRSMLVPLVVATKTMLVNGKPVVVGGPIITELASLRQTPVVDNAPPPPIKPVAAVPSRKTGRAVANRSARRKTVATNSNRRALACTTNSRTQCCSTQPAPGTAGGAPATALKRYTQL